jgi:hypothetical protein
MNTEEMIWQAINPDQRLDSLDQAIYAIGHVHGKARREGVLLSLELYDAIRFEFSECRRISRVLTEDQRRSICNELDNTIGVFSLLDMMLNVWDAGEE